MTYITWEAGINRRAIKPEFSALRDAHGREIGSVFNIDTLTGEAEVLAHDSKGNILLDIEGDVIRVKAVYSAPICVKPHPKGTN